MGNGSWWSGHRRVSGARSGSSRPGPAPRWPSPPAGPSCSKGPWPQPGGRRSPCPATYSSTGSASMRWPRRWRVRRPRRRRVRRRGLAAHPTGRRRRRLCGAGCSGPTSSGRPWRPGPRSPTWRPPAGRLLLLGSSSVGRPYPGLVPYTTTKAALHELARGLRNEYPWLAGDELRRRPHPDRVRRRLGSRTGDRDVRPLDGRGLPAGPAAMTVEEMAGQVVKVLASGARIDEVR